MLEGKISFFKRLTITNPLLLLLLMVFSGNNVRAQPNGGFEEWTTEFSYEVPNGWQTINFLSLSNPPAALSAFKATGLDVHSGNYALKLKTVLVSNNQFPGFLGDSIGGCFTGKINISPFSYQFGYPYTGRPEKLEFWAKYNPVGNDTAAAAVLLRQWNGVKHDTIAGGVLDILPSPGFINYQINLDYSMSGPTDVPDSAIIVFYPSKDSAVARINSTLFIDDVSLTGWVGIEDKEKMLNTVKVFPNPATNNITIQPSGKNSQNIRIMDISGKQVCVVQVVENQFYINTSVFANGLYFFEIRDSSKRVTSRGKFKIIR